MGEPQNHVEFLCWKRPLDHQAQAPSNVLFFLLPNLSEFCWWLLVYTKLFEEHRSP